MTDKKRIIIIGGVAGGASAAARCRRLSEEAEITIFERNDYISFANCGMPYHIGGVIEDRDKLLVQSVEGMHQRYNINVRCGCEVTSIDRKKKTITYTETKTGKTGQQSYDKLVLSPGAEPAKPPLPGADNPRVFSLRNLEDMDAIKTAAQEYASKPAVVVGGGYIGLEMAEALRDRGMEVILVELADQVFIAADREMATPLHQQIRLHGVDLRLEVSVTAINDLGNELEVVLSDGKKANCGIVIMAVGVRPDAKLAREAGLEMGELRGIVVNDNMQTSDPDIYAVGDAVEVTSLVGGHKALIPLAGPANRQGRIAADNIFGRSSTYKNTQGTSVCKVFDLTMAMTGASEKQLKKSGTRYEKIYVHPGNHAGYYPGSSQINMKLIFDPETGRVLGAQAVGASGVEKRIDVISVAVRAGLTVEDLSEQELCYAPPYGSAKDPVNYAGFVANNVITGDSSICHCEDVISPRDDQLVLDVRTPAEVEAGTIPGAKNIPVDDIRDRFEELPRDKELLIFCRVGIRGYLACRTLTQKGFKCRNLTGGYTTYQHYVGATGHRIAKPVPRINLEAANLEVAKMAKEIKMTIDARALQCPGPIMKLKSELKNIKTGDTVEILVSDHGFPADVEAWCAATGNRLVEVKPYEGAYRAVIEKGGATATEVATTGGTDKTMVIFSGDLDKVLAGFVIANGAAAMGSKVTMFFTFWGINALRKGEHVPVKKNFIEKMFGWMMPRGADKLSLSNMNMLGMGKMMIKGIMKKKNVASLPELIASAQEAGVRLVVCTMTMDLMGIKKEELIDGVEEGGVAAFLGTADKASVNLFI